MIPCNENMIRLNVVAFLATLQLVIPDTCNSDKIKGFGSGFLLRHKDRLFFITADHVVHLDDHDPANETGQRIGIDYSPQIITNIKIEGELKSINLPVGGFYHLTGFGFDKDSLDNPEKFISIFNKIIDGVIDINDEKLPLDVRIASLPDMAISELKEPLSVPLLSNQVIMQNKEVLIQEGMPKLSLFSTHSKNFNNDNRYLVAGTICNEIKNSTVLNRINVLHEGLIFERLDNDRYAILKIPTLVEVDIQYWAGLSGAPILDDNGLLAGMLIRGPEKEPFVTAVPIEKIIWFLDMIIKNEDNIQPKS